MRGDCEAHEMRGEISRGESEAHEAARGDWEPHETLSSSCRLRTCCARDGGEPISSPLSSARLLAAASLSTPTQPSSSRLPGDTFFCAATAAIAIPATTACGRGGLPHRGGDE